MVTLRNRSSRMLSLHLPELGSVRHTVVTNDRNKATGEVGVRRVQKDLPEVITLCARGTDGDARGGLPDAVASSPEVLSAKAKGLLTVELSAAPPAAPPAPPADPQPEEAAPAAAEE